MILYNQAKYVKERVYRVKVSSANGYASGSGFFISPRKFLTCFHVVFLKELRNLRNDSDFIRGVGADEHEKLQSYFSNKITGIEIGIGKNIWITATLDKFEEKYDIAVLDVDIGKQRVNICNLNWDPKINYGDYVFFGGFPTHHEYDPDKAPFTAHEGMVSSFNETTVGGNKYEHIQINSINLGGNSGAPLFKKGRSKVIGIVNGNMLRGNTNVLFQNPETNQTIRGPLLIPLSIAYATSLKLLKDKIS